MRTLLIGVALFAAAQGGYPLPGTPDTTSQAGRLTLAQVLVINKDPRTEAIPVTMAGAEPVRVAFAGPPAVTINGAVSADAKAARQVWEYQQLTVGAREDPTPTLNAAGAQGWEVTGAVIPRAAGVTIVMKRPR